MEQDRRKSVFGQIFFAFYQQSKKENLIWQNVF